MSPAQRRANLAASVRTRLLNLSRQRRTEFQQVLAEFAVERLLYRLGASAHADRFVLKGAMLFRLWPGDHHRATWDLDLLGRGPHAVADVVAAIRTLCRVHAEDGLEFDAASVAGEETRVEDAYAGVRVRLEARLAEARIPVLVDVGFGDAIHPAPTKAQYPTLLDHAPPLILVYPRETVIAEKLEAIISLGVTNSRMKDFYDIYLLASSFTFEGQVLTQSIRATFARRRTPLPTGKPLVLTRAFLNAPERQTQWRAFLRRARLETPLDGGDLSELLTSFLLPVLAAATTGQQLQNHWPAGGPWQAIA